MSGIGGVRGPNLPAVSPPIDQPEEGVEAPAVAEPAPVSTDGVESEAMARAVAFQAQFGAQDPSVRPAGGAPPANGTVLAGPGQSSVTRDLQDWALQQLTPSPRMLGHLVPGEGRSFQFNHNAGLAEVTATATTAPRTAEPGQDPRVQVEVRTELQAGASPSLPFVAGANAQFGSAMTTQFSLPTAEFEAMRAGQRSFPDVMDPRTLPDGASASVRAEFTTTHGFHSRIPGAGIVSGVRDMRTDALGRAVNVERNGNRVTVTAGDAETVQRDVDLRLRALPGLPVTNSTELRQVTGLQRREFDISSEEGRRDYQDFLRQSLTPRPAGEGAAPVGSTPESRTEFQQRTGINLPSVLGFRSNIELSRSEAERTVTQTPEGSVVDRRVRADDVSFRSQSRVGPDGTVTGGEVDVRFNGMAPDSLQAMRYAFGAEGRNGGAPELRLDAESLSALQGRIRDTYSQQQLGTMSDAHRVFFEDLLAARTPYEAAAAMSRRRSGDVAAVALANLRMDHPEQLPLPGGLR